MRHLLLDLNAPLMSFGGDMVDAYGVVRDFPALSMVAGLIANALGWERHQADAHARLQERLVMGSARVGEGQRIRDFQTAKLEKDDKGWTTRSRVEGRAGGGDTYKSPHIRYRDADAGARVLVALRLDPAAEEPTLEQVADAIDAPERPLFVGRKPFLPSRPLRLGIADAETIADALAAGLPLLPDPPAGAASIRAQWPYDGAPADRERVEELTDERHWPAGVHAGLRRVTVGTIPRPVAEPPAETAA